ncbi:probable serine/threonine-protein kinase DDB_G0282963 isoform X2 [Limulus polyphemus]|uniref:Probable serine/threonine-protein kinase DDB_G0282963 isoform X2 n=1 Tax=Limulus polyphemus TaxID=6850 RepID=A0ABM1SMI3_LIMPO|nr:probable serine/threonine-protein kinase DDB_G0282963 isoform X2 [Limulus polyphemus]
MAVVGVSTCRCFIEPIFPAFLSLLYSRDYYTVGEGKQSKIVLLDGRQLDILVQPKLYTSELLDMVSSHLNLKEKEYFGLAFLDDSGHYCWLQMDRKVMEHQFPKKYNNGPLILHFMIKYFAPSIRELRYNVTLEAFYQQAKILVYEGVIEPNSETVFYLAALALQEIAGDYTDDQKAKEQLKHLPVLPTNTLKKHPSLFFCEERVITHYRNLCGSSRGATIIKYMKIVERISAYGVHYYEVKDKEGLPWWIGLNYKGISLYDYIDRKTPRKFFPWEKLENIYFKQKKFSIEVRNRKRVHTTRRPLGSGNLKIHTWFTTTSTLAKTIWMMAVAQHQFHLVRNNGRNRVSSLRNYEEMADTLSRTFPSSISSRSSPSLRMSRSSPSLSVFKREGLDRVIECIDSGQLDMKAALKARKETLEEALRHKTDELKLLCIKEAELTGEVPLDIPLAPGEAPPSVRRRVGTSFALNDKLFHKARSKKEEALTKVELEYEIQSKIASAALKLASDTTVKRNVRKQRKTAHQRAVIKLKDLEQKLATLKKQTEIIKAKQRKQSSDGEQSRNNHTHSEDEKGERNLLKEDNDLYDASSQQITRSNGKKSRELLNKDVLVSKNSSTPSSSSFSFRQFLSSLAMPMSPCSAPSSPIKHRQPSQERRRFSMSLPRSPFQTASLSIRRLSAQPFTEQNYKANALNQLKICSVTQQLTKICSSGPQSTCSACSDYETISSEGGSALSLRTSHICPRFELRVDAKMSDFCNQDSQRTSLSLDSPSDILNSSLSNCDEQNDLFRDSFSDDCRCLPKHPNHARCLSFDFSSKSKGYDKFLSVPREIQKYHKYSDTSISSISQTFESNAEDQLNRFSNKNISSPNIHPNNSGHLFNNGNNNNINIKDQQLHKYHDHSGNEGSETVKGIPEIVFPSSEENITVVDKSNTHKHFQHFLSVKQNRSYNEETSDYSSVQNNKNYSSHSKKTESPNLLTSSEVAEPIHVVNPSTSNTTQSNENQPWNSKYLLHHALNQRRGSDIYSSPESSPKKTPFSPGNPLNRRKGSFSFQKEYTLGGINRSAEMKSLLSFWSSLNSSASQHSSLPSHYSSKNMSPSQNQSENQNVPTNQHPSLNTSSKQHLLVSSSSNCSSVNSSVNQCLSLKLAPTHCSALNASTNQQTSLNSSINHHLSANKYSSKNISKNQNSSPDATRGCYFHKGNQVSASLSLNNRTLNNSFNHTCMFNHSTICEGERSSSTCRYNIAFKKHSIGREFSNSDFETTSTLVEESTNSSSAVNSSKNCIFPQITPAFGSAQNEMFLTGKPPNVSHIIISPCLKQANLSDQSQEVSEVNTHSSEGKTTGLNQELDTCPKVQSFEFDASTSSGSLAEDFHHEMIAWYENHEGMKNTTFL